MRSSLHLLIPFLSLFCSCQFRRLDSIQFQAKLPEGWRPEIRLLLFYPAEHFLMTTLHGPCRKHKLYCSEGLFTNLLPSNGRPTVARLRLCGNVFTESLNSNGYIRHKTYTHTYRQTDRQTNRQADDTPFSFIIAFRESQRCKCVRISRSILSISQHYIICTAYIRK
jgi:hypothetical protein